jgi:hypothetical protein
MAEYLGMTLDAKLRWKEHVKKKIEELNIKYRKVKWLLGRMSQLSIENKILVYNQIIKLVWTYRIQLWGCASKSNIKRVQKFQNIVLRGIVNALGTPVIATSIGILALGWSLLKLKGQPRSMKIGFTSTLTWKRYSYSTTRGQ